MPYSSRHRRDYGSDSAERGHHGDYYSGDGGEYSGRGSGRRGSSDRGGGGGGYRTYSSQSNSDRGYSDGRSYSNGSYSSGNRHRSSEGGGWNDWRSGGRHDDRYTDDAQSGQGVIEKLKDAYGFISSVEPEGSFFFHFSELSVHVDDAQVGDEVEFVLRTDRKTGKAVATKVDILEPGTINRVEIQEQEVEGQIFRAGKMVRSSDNRRSSTYNDRDESGSIAYVKAPTDSEESERKLRVTYMAADVANSEELREGDKVTFQLAIDRLTRKQRAVNIKVVEKAVFPTVDGIIASLKDAFGFIARADCDDEVFFHFSEFLADEHPAVGDEVRFELQERGDRTTAVRVLTLPPGSVSLEDVGDVEFRGQVVKPIRRVRSDQRDFSASGLIAYTLAGSEDKPDVECKVTFTENDVNRATSADGDAVGVLRPGDVVTFKVATDNRNSKRRRAVDLELVERAETLADREEGIVGTLKDGFGFIKCAQRDTRLFFHFSELIDPDSIVDISVNACVEFTVAPVRGRGKEDAKLQAIMIKILPPGSVQFETISDERVLGTVAQTPSRQQGGSKGGQNRSDGARSSSYSSSELPGQITCLQGDETVTVTFSSNDVTDVRTQLRVGDKVEFNVRMSKRTAQRSAVNITLVERHVPQSAPSQAPLPRHGSTESEVEVLGIVSSLKEKFGFIESADLTGEVFFHFSELNQTDIEVGDVVTYTECLDRGERSRKSAIRVRRLDASELAAVQGLDQCVHEGVVVQGLRQRDSKCGLLEYQPWPLGHPTEETLQEPRPAERIKFGASSLLGARGDVPHQGDRVTFQIAFMSGAIRAVHVALVQRCPTNVSSDEKIVASVVSVKGKYGFIGHAVEGLGSDTLYFHTTEVKGREELQPGDKVMFGIGERNGKPVAVSITLFERKKEARPSARPQHLCQQRDGAAASKSVLLREPFGPVEGSNGFTGPLRGRGLAPSLVTSPEEAKDPKSVTDPDNIIASSTPNANY